MPATTGGCQDSIATVTAHFHSSQPWEVSRSWLVGRTANAISATTFIIDSKIIFREKLDYREFKRVKTYLNKTTKKCKKPYSSIRDLFLRTAIVSLFKCRVLKHVSFNDSFHNNSSKTFVFLCNYEKMGLIKRMSKHFPNTLTHNRMLSLQREPIWKLNTTARQNKG